MGKTVYVASRFNKRLKVKEIFSRLEKLGYSISYDWTNHKSIKPYEDNEELSRDYSIEDIKNSIQSDYFILLTSEAGTGMYVKLGSAIFSNIINGKPKIYVVGNYINRSMFYFHPAVERIKNIEDLLTRLEPEIDNSNPKLS